MTGAPPALSTAAVATAAHTTELRDFPVPRIGPDDGLLRVEAAAICGTDWEIYGRRSRGQRLGPLILGHENVGRVVTVGERAAERWGVAVGDRVAVEEFLPCGTCRLCRGGHYRLCAATDSRGAGPFLRYGSTPVSVAPSLYGGFSQYLYLHPRAIVYPVGDDVEPELAALFVPVANGIRWVTGEGGLRLGQTLVVLGPGQHGLGCVIAAREAGAGKVIVAGTAADRHRLDVATALGADHVVAEAAAEAVLDLTGGAGADVVVDLAPGATGTVERAIAMCAPRGTVVLAASKHARPVDGFPHDLVVRKEVRLLGVRGHDHRSVEPALELISSGRWPLRLLATHRFPLDRADEALRMAGQRTDPAAIHVSILPNGVS
ncbi:MAG TPA: zinc-binding dehydrogenase [Streptosporangiaceae bacterium]|jgi:threonine dehydrogenase-like Zn-dependent dehydrogenase|nr:zinc-binding dehydrogenase [Streptosporangiaceae bacterium]